MQQIEIPVNTPDEQVKTTAERAYRLIRDDIVSGALDPGQKLKIGMLRERYGLGAGPLREALAKLSGDFLIRMEEQRGCFVAPMSIPDCEEIGEMRQLLEVCALSSSIPNGDERWEVDVITSFHRLERLEKSEHHSSEKADEWELLNNRFHDALVGACTSQWMLRVRLLLFDQHERYRYLSRDQTDIPRDVHEEHRMLFDAALDRDVNKAVSIIKLHIQRTTDAVTRALSD